MSTGGILIVAFIVIMVIAAVANRNKKNDDEAQQYVKKTHRGNSTVHFLYGLCPSQGRLFALPQLLPRSRRQTRSKGVRPPRGR